MAKGLPLSVCGWSVLLKGFAARTGKGVFPLGMPRDKGIAHYASFQFKPLGRITREVRFSQPALFLYRVVNPSTNVTGNTHSAEGLVNVKYVDAQKPQVSVLRKVGNLGVSSSVVLLT
ncbi:hypothetical protein TNCV_575081 [Trichonephila clavipes]|nr:hypothetical protein TNCV_575081 [Trichonephila clavipes]